MFQPCYQNQTIFLGLTSVLCGFSDLPIYGWILHPSQIHVRDGERQHCWPDMDAKGAPDHALQGWATKDPGPWGICCLPRQHHLAPLQGWVPGGWLLAVIRIVEYPAKKDAMRTFVNIRGVGWEDVCVKGPLGWQVFFRLYSKCHENDQMP